jgi:hypothetical protein
MVILARDILGRCPTLPVSFFIIKLAYPFKYIWRPSHSSIMKSTNHTRPCMGGGSEKGDIYGFGGLKVPQLEQVFKFTLMDSTRGNF